MNRYLFQVRYDYPDGSGTYEPVCIDAASEAAATTDVLAATARHATLTNATRTTTVVLVVLDV